jgi:hypothetical protein
MSTAPATSSCIGTLPSSCYRLSSPPGVIKVDTMPDLQRFLALMPGRTGSGDDDGGRALGGVDRALTTSVDGQDPSNARPAVSPADGPGVTPWAGQ